MFKFAVSICDLNLRHRIHIVPFLRLRLRRRSLGIRNLGRGLCASVQSKMQEKAAYGTWKSPISADTLTQKASSTSSVPLLRCFSYILFFYR